MMHGKTALKFSVFRCCADVPRELLQDLKGLTARETLMSVA